MKLFFRLLIVSGCCSLNLMALETPFQYQLKSSAFFYNHENSGHWEETEQTKTYLGQVLEPTASARLTDKISLQIGAGVYFEFNQEKRFSGAYPMLRSTFHHEWLDFIMGSLDPDHNLPRPILTPVSRIVPQLRRLDLESTNFAHGRYEYGFQWLRKKGDFHFDLFLNWQLLDTHKHRERFDIGIITSWNKGLPWYFTMHQWHNGGHEFERPDIPEVTENYNFALGVRNQDRYSFLMMASMDYPNRSKKETHKKGYGAYAEINETFDWLELSIRLWASSKDQPYKTHEGDLFYNHPLYAEIGLARTWKWNDLASLSIVFDNGFYQTKNDQSGLRNDQSIVFDILSQF